MTEIIKGTNQKPNASRALVELFSQANLGGVLYVGYPLISTPHGKEGIDAVWISEEKGLVIFSLLEGQNPIGEDELEQLQDNSAILLESKLKTSDTRLSLKRKLRIPISTLTFAPAYSSHMLSTYSDSEYVIANEDSLLEEISSVDDWTDKQESIYELVLSSLQNISNVRANGNTRHITKENSKGYKLKSLEDSIATLDVRQSKAVIETVNGVQRIRGLAGSGKTVILALKAAYIHAQHPDWKIAVTFNTRSLKGQLRKLIHNFTISAAGEEPNWENLKVINAWGGAGNADRSGLYYEFVSKKGLEYLDFGLASKMFGADLAFSGVCQKALADLSIKGDDEANYLYDLILVDEAQDFPPEFLKLCYLALSEEKRLVYAYDELQQLSSHSLPSPEEIFGKDANGQPIVSLEPNSNQDIILSTCYRNSRPVLATAHAIGFGIYRKPNPRIGTGIVQMFQNKQLWMDVGYEIQNGNLDMGEHVRLQRTEKSSPKFLEDNIDSPTKLIEFISFPTKDEQDLWVANEIKKNLSEEDLLPEDIIVINPHPLTAKNNLGLIRRTLFDNRITTHFAGVDTSADIFFNKGSIAFTGIYRAKGNEAGMVYIVNSDECVSPSNQATLRNRLFTAITRSKAWVRVLGVGASMDELKNEFDQVVANNFTLDFIYPTEQQIKDIAIIHREMTRTVENEVKQVNQSLDEAIEQLKKLKQGDTAVTRQDIDEKLFLLKDLFESLNENGKS